MECTFFFQLSCPCRQVQLCNPIQTERHNIASRMVLKVDSKGSADRLAQYDLHITEQVSNHAIPPRSSPHLFNPSIPDQARRTCSRPGAILASLYASAKLPSWAGTAQHRLCNPFFSFPYPNRPPTPPSHRVLRSLRRNEELRSSTTPVRQLHELNIQNRHSHLIDIKYCQNTRPGAQLGAPQQQHSELSQLLHCAKNFKVQRSLSTQSSCVRVGLSILPTPWTI
eukprot:1160618-Pelagomonas_calceolata.AAC.1